MVLVQDPRASGEDARVRSTKRSCSPRPSAPKKAKGASSGGYFRSILKERSVAFNLQLDVQNMQQEIQNLMMARDLLNTRIVRQRHEPSGSLMLKVKAYYETFRLGWAINDGRRRFSRTAPEQREFIRYLFDQDVWVGNGLYGVQIMTQQHEIYSTFFRIIELRMHSYDIVDTEDSVVIKSSAVLRLQIVRATIMEIFPHILGHEDLVRRLIGRQVDAPITHTYFFDAKGAVTRFETELDMVAVLMSLLNDPVDVAVLLGDALMYENSMFGLHSETESASDDRSDGPSSHHAPYHQHDSPDAQSSSSPGMRIAHILQ